MRSVRSAFRGVNALHYVAILLMAGAFVLAALGTGGAWLVARKGDCTAYFYARSLSESGCEGFDNTQYYKCGESFCKGCEGGGKGMLCLSVFGLITSVISILLTLKRVFRDIPKDWASRNIKKVSVGCSGFATILYLLSWIVFLSACESSLGYFDSNEPHTGFVLMFLAMCASAGSCVMNLITIDPASEIPGRNKSTLGILSNEQKSDAMVDRSNNDNVVDDVSGMKSHGEENNLSQELQEIQCGNERSEIQGDNSGSDNLAK